MERFGRIDQASVTNRVLVRCLGMDSPQSSILRSNGATVGLWIVWLGSLSVAGLLATAFAMMAFGLDPSEIVTAGAEPWTNAMIATSAVVGLAAIAGLSLWLWHFTRFRPISLILTAISVGLVIWASISVYTDYI